MSEKKKMLRGREACQLHLILQKLFVQFKLSKRKTVTGNIDNMIHYR